MPRPKFLPNFALNLITRNHTTKGTPFCGGSLKLDGYTLVQLIRNCTKHGHFLYGQQLHSYIMRSGFTSNVFISSSLVGFYAKLGSLADAHKLFVEMPERNVVTCNTMISGYVHSGKLHKALHLFLDLNRSNIRVDAYSFTSVLAVCGQLCLVLLGMSLHSKIVVYGLDSNVVVANCLIDMYGKCSFVDDAVCVFNELVDKDVISWNSIIAASARNQRIELAFSYFHQMPYPDTISYNELINGIAQFGNIDEAIDILKNMPEPNSSSWNAIITGYVLRNKPWEALDFLTQMHSKGIITDEYTFSSILSGISCLSAFKWGSLLHGCIIKQGLVASTIIGSALIDMYSKCGHIKDAQTLFHSLPSKNIVTWSTMLSGFAHNGESHKVIKYFEELEGLKGLKPDDITFVNLLAACSHNKLPLEKAYGYFKSMISEYGIEPRPEHLASMIKIMGDHGEIKKAEKMIYELGFGFCTTVWRALLGACEACGNLEVAKFAAMKMAELEGRDEFGYVLLSNINKGCGNWVDATSVWDMMKDRGVVKKAGSSWIEVGSGIAIG